MIQEANPITSNFNQHSKGKTLVLFGAFTLLFGLVYFLTFDPKIDLNGDNASYLILGKALAGGAGYTNIQLPEPTPHNHYPMGYPALIAATIWVAGDATLPVKLLNGLFFYGSLLLLFSIARRVLPWRLAAFITIFCLLNLHLLNFASMMMSEIPYLFFSLLTLWLAMQTDYAKPVYRNLWFGLVIISLAACFYIKASGLALLAGMALYLLFHTRWTYLLSMLTGFGLLISPAIWRSMSLGGSSYLTQVLSKNPYHPEAGQLGVHDGLVRLLANALRYLAREIPSGLFNFLQVTDYSSAYSLLEWGLGSLILGLVLYGIYQCRQYRALLAGYLAATFGILLLWPQVWYGVRFLMPVIPILAIYFFAGLWRLPWGAVSIKLRLSPPPHILPLLVVLGMVLLFGYAWQPVQRLYQKAQSPMVPAYRHYLAAAEWLKANAAPDAVTCSRKGSLFYLHSGQPVVKYLATTDAPTLIGDLRAKGVDYVVLGALGFSSTTDYLLPAINQFPDKFEQVLRTKEPETILFRFRPQYGYTGDWHEGKRNGYGTYVWKNGTRYEGAWVNNLREGKGTLYLPGGHKIEGSWMADKKEGEALVYMPDGLPEEVVIYKSDSIVHVKKYSAGTDSHHTDIQ